jgi:hypothetical protein
MTPIEKFMSEYNLYKPLHQQVEAAIREAVGAEREACAKLVDQALDPLQSGIRDISDVPALIRSRKDTEQ